MGRLRTIGRRSFLIGSTAVMGGVAFGTFMAQRPHVNPLAAGLGDGEATFNPFVKVTADKITIIAPHADKGQGVQSAQAALVAEELDVTLDQVEISFGDPSPAYFNTALAADIAPFMSFDESLTARSVRGVLGAVGKIMGLMGTGGSSSMPDSFDKLRMAGAVARETLKLAASGVHGVPVSDLRTEAGHVMLPDGTALPYQQLAASAATLPPVTRVALRDPSQWRLIGQPMERTDIVAKSTGTLAYGIDRDIPGMVHAAVRFNPRQGGEMRGFDAAAAEAMRGVQQVVQVDGRIVEQDATGQLVTRHGPIGVAAIADNTWRAFQAVNAVAVDWGPAPYPPEMEGHWDAVTASFTPERLDRIWRDDGDVDAALASGEVVQAEYRVPYVAHAPLEPLSAIIRVDDDGAEVWSGHQLQRFVQQKVAEVAGLDDPDKVIFHNEFIGGSFGHRLEFEHLLVCADIARKLKGTPVKLTFTREEDFAHDFPRQIGMARMSGTVSEAGIESYDADIATVSVVSSQAGRLGQPVPGPDSQIAAGIWNMPFDIPNTRISAYRVPELAPTSSWRSVGASSQGFFGESFMDELCHAAGLDPLEERLRLVNNDVHRKVLEAVGDMSDWGSDLGAGRGRGIALVESFGVPCAEVVEVTATDRGIRIDKVFVAADVGTVIDPLNFENLVMGGVIWGLGHAINSEITYSDGVAQQTNYHAHEGMRIYQCPDITVRGLENANHVRGIGEPPVPPAAPALANAIFAATGTRLREMPFNKFMQFV